jgi:hypothetical protein
LIAALATCFELAGCAGAPDPAFAQQRGLKCVDDSNVCISQRKMVFDSYMADKSRAWIKQPAGPHEYASGVRLMAYSKMRKDLSCEQLAHAKEEADRGPASLLEEALPFPYVAGTALDPATRHRGRSHLARLNAKAHS